MNVDFSTRLPWSTGTNQLWAARAELLTEHVEVLDLCESNPTRVGLEPPPVVAREVFATPESVHYEPNPHGLSEARLALAELYQRRAAPSRLLPPTLDVDDLFLCASTSEAYAWLFKLLCDPGDAVLVPKPGYPLFEHLAGLEAVVPRPYRLEYSHPGGWRIDLASVEEALCDGRARALVLINPNNPTGSYVREAEREHLVAMCAHHGCALIVDEVFYDYPLEIDCSDEAVARSSFIAEERALCFVLDGLSKRLCLPQMKLAWIAVSGPRRARREARRRLEIIADAYLSTGTPIMHALPHLLAAAEQLSGPCWRRIAANLERLRHILEGPSSPHRVRRCDGGWTAIVESPRLLDEEHIALGLLREKRLWVQPGYFYDMEEDGCFAVSLIVRSADLERGARAYASYFARLCGE